MTGQTGTITVTNNPAQQLIDHVLSGQSADWAVHQLLTGAATEQEPPPGAVEPPGTEPAPTVADEPEGTQPVLLMDTDPVRADPADREPMDPAPAGDGWDPHASVEDIKAQLLTDAYRRRSAYDPVGYPEKHLVASEEIIVELDQEKDDWLDDLTEKRGLRLQSSWHLLPGDRLFQLTINGQVYTYAAATGFDLAKAVDALKDVVQDKRSTGKDIGKALSVFKKSTVVTSGSVKGVPKVARGTSLEKMYQATA